MDSTILALQAIRYSVGKNIYTIYTFIHDYLVSNKLIASENIALI